VTGAPHGRVKGRRRLRQITRRLLYTRRVSHRPMPRMHTVAPPLANKALIDRLSRQVRVPQDYTPTDAFAGLSLACLVLLGAPLALTQALAILPPLALVHAYGLSLPTPLADVPTGSFAFRATRVCAVILALPSMVLTFAWVWVCRVAVSAVSLPWGLATGNRILQSYQALAPYRGSPGLPASVKASDAADAEQGGAPRVKATPQGQAPRGSALPQTGRSRARGTNEDEGMLPRTSVDAAARAYGARLGMGDTVVALVGALHRQGFCHCHLGLVAMVWTVPAYKAAVLGNFWVYALEPCFVNQWTPPLDDEKRPHAADRAHARAMVVSEMASAKPGRSTRDLRASWAFTGHYPRASPARGGGPRAAVGVQFLDGDLMTAMLVHAILPPDAGAHAATTLPSAAPSRGADMGGPEAEGGPRGGGGTREPCGPKHGTRLGKHEAPPSPPRPAPPRLESVWVPDVARPAQAPRRNHALTPESDERAYEPRSKHAAATLACIYMQAWNPLHVHTGYVEVNMRRDGGVERAMWLVLAARTSRLHGTSLFAVNLVFVRLAMRFRDHMRARPAFFQRMPRNLDSQRAAVAAPAAAGEASAEYASSVMSIDAAAEPVSAMV